MRKNFFIRLSVQQLHFDFVLTCITKFNKIYQNALRIRWFKENTSALEQPPNMNLDEQQKQRKQRQNVV